VPAGLSLSGDLAERLYINGREGKGREGAQDRRCESVERAEEADSEEENKKEKENQHGHCHKVDPVCDVMQKLICMWVSVLIHSAFSLIYPLASGN
jgi:hypothetical protein